MGRQRCIEPSDIGIAALRILTPKGGVNKHTTDTHRDIS